MQLYSRHLQQWLARTGRLESDVNERRVKHARAHIFQLVADAVQNRRLERRARERPVVVRVAETRRCAGESRRRDDVIGVGGSLLQRLVVDRGRVAAVFVVDGGVRVRSLQTRCASEPAHTR